MDFTYLVLIFDKYLIIHIAANKKNVVDYPVSAKDQYYSTNSCNNINTLMEYICLIK